MRSFIVRFRDNDGDTCEVDQHATSAAQSVARVHTGYGHLSDGAPYRVLISGSYWHHIPYADAARVPTGIGPSWVCPECLISNGGAATHCTECNGGRP